MKIATIARNTADSPNMVENDAALLQSIEERLAAMGHYVKRTNETELFDGYDAICHMTRTPEILALLKDVEKTGCKVINTPAAVERCSREAFTQILDKNDIPQPPHRAITTIDDTKALQFPGWIKKSNGWSRTKEDIAYVTNKEEATEAFNYIKENGNNALYFEHIKGDIIKFYAVNGYYFTYLYPQCKGTKFGYEKINGTANHYPFDNEVLKKTAFDAATAIGLDIFGGDAIITPEGDIYIIDINDFPSFSAVREIAARHIADSIILKASK